MNTLSSSSPRTSGWTNIGVGALKAHDREVGESGKRGGGLLAEQMRRVAIAEDRRELGV
jgi:hypothetical protein